MNPTSNCILHNFDERVNEYVLEDEEGTVATVYAEGYGNMLDTFLRPIIDQLAYRLEICFKLNVATCHIASE